MKKEEFGDINKNNLGFAENSVLSLSGAYLLDQVTWTLLMT